MGSIGGGRQLGQCDWDSPLDEDQGSLGRISKINVWDHNDHNGSKNCIGCYSNYDHAYLVELNKVHSSASHTGQKLGSKLMY